MVFDRTRFSGSELPSFRPVALSLLVVGALASGCESDDGSGSDTGALASTASDGSGSASAPEGGSGPGPVSPGVGGAGPTVEEPEAPSGDGGRPSSGGSGPSG